MNTSQMRLRSCIRCYHPLSALVQALGAGEPWQRRVLLSGSSITLEQWLGRRMLRRGRCLFCCSSAPDPARRHPEPALAPLVQLCADCHTNLEADAWKRWDGACARLGC